MNSPNEHWLQAKESCWQGLMGSASGLAWSDAWTEIVDQAIREITYEVEREHEVLDQVSVVATGGYGRRDLSPHSDVDLIVIPLDERAPGLDGAIRALFRELHRVLSDALGLKVDYAYRLVGDAPGLDPKSRTALLESRLVAGSDRPYDHLLDHFWETFPVGDFLIEKLEEREKNYRETNDSPLVVTPDLKEGAGGLRDFHAANWIRQAMGERGQSPSRSYDQVLAVRNSLHITRARKADVLSHGAQGEVAAHHGLDHQELMERLHGAMIELHQGWREATEKISESRFQLAEGVHAIRGEVRIAAGTPASDAAMGVANATRLGIRVLPIAAGCTPEVAGNQAIRAIAHGEEVLRNLEHCKVLEALLPELVATRTLLPDDQSHQFTVYEHTLRVVRNLDSLRTQTGFLGDTYRRISDKGALMLGVLLHDVGKADPSDSHSITGERTASEIGTRWGLDQNRRELVAWLVREHLSMSKTIRLRDVQHPETSAEFAQTVGTMERLLMLTVLTWADSSAVGPGVWTHTQESFLRELFERTEAVLQAQEPPVTDPEAFRRLAKRQLSQIDAGDAAVQEFLTSLPAHYLLSTPPVQIPHHFEFVKRAKAGETVVEFEPIADLRVTELTIAAHDSPGLLSRVLGVLYAHDISLIGVRACTTKDAEPTALDVLTISLAGGQVPPSTCASLRASIRALLHDEAALIALLQAKGKSVDLEVSEPTVNYLPGKPGILEVRGRRGRGFAFRLSRHITRQGWNILGARVGQWAGLSTASFTLEGRENQELQTQEVTAAFAPKV